MDCWPAAAPEQTEEAAEENNRGGAKQTAIKDSCCYFLASMQSPLSTAWAAKSPKLKGEKKTSSTKKLKASSLTATLWHLTAAHKSVRRITCHTHTHTRIPQKTFASVILDCGTAVFAQLLPRHEIYFVLWIWLLWRRLLCSIWSSCFCMRRKRLSDAI